MYWFFFNFPNTKLLKKKSHQIQSLWQLLHTWMPSLQAVLSPSEVVTPWLLATPGRAEWAFGRTMTWGGPPVLLPTSPYVLVVPGESDTRTALNSIPSTPIPVLRNMYLVSVETADMLVIAWVCGHGSDSFLNLIFFLKATKRMRSKMMTKARTPMPIISPGPM